MNFTELFAILFTICVSSCDAGESGLSIEGNEFHLNGKYFPMWGIRTASATQADEYTERLIDALKDYKRHGANSINVYVQGSSGGFSDPFKNQGKDIEKNHYDRLVRIIEACEEHAMVPIVGIFYQRVMANVDSVRNLHSREAVFHAVETITERLKPYRNLILNIANEQNSFFYDRFNAFDFRDPQNIIALCKHVKKLDPDRVVGAGGYNDSLNIIIGKSQFVDVLLFDTSPDDVEGDHHSAWHYDHFRANGVPDKPMVNVEIFGGWTKKFMPPGVYPEEGRHLHTREIDVSLERPGLYVHFHSNPWCQGPSMGNYPVRFGLGGDGTKDNPGIRWWFEYLKSHVTALGSS